LRKEMRDMIPNMARLTCLVLHFLAFSARAVMGLGGSSVTEPFPQASSEVVRERSVALNGLRATVTRFVEEEAIVGAELLVIEHGHVLLHETFGWRDREEQLSMEPNTIFNIRSMTKPLVGAAIQILIDQCRLRLDQPVADFLPGFDNDASRTITVEHLLTHRSGLPPGIVQSVNEYASLFAQANAAGERGPEFEPGSRFSYSDAGAEALGAIVEVVTKMTLEEFLQSRLLGPLGMEDTFGALDSDDPRWDRVASLYFGRPGSWMRIWRPKGASMYPFLWGSQGLYSTPADYARFLALWMDKGICGNRRILSEDAIARTLTPRSVCLAMGDDRRQPTNFAGLEVYYGQMAVLYTQLGAGNRSDPVVIGHGGSDGTIAWAWPDRDLMVLYFTQSRGNLTFLRLERAIEWLLIDPESHPTPPDPARLTPYFGEYIADFGPFRNALFKVFEQDGFLAVEIPDQITTELRDPTPEGRWASVVIDRVFVMFERDDSGEVTALKWQDGDSIYVLPRAMAAANEAVNEASLARFTGRYRIPEAGLDVEVLIRKGGLAVSIPGTGLVELDNPDDEGFLRLRVNPSVRIRFDEDPDGNMVSFTAYMPDGSTFVRPRITEGEEPERQ
jgi:CubicO group peptidase (beta-lactamase class C family)